MNRIFHILLLCLLCVSLTMAQKPGNRPAGTPGQSQVEDGQQAFMKFLEDKTNFIISEMELPEQSAAQFRQIYCDMQKEKGELMRRYDAIHKIMIKYRRHENITDEEYLKAVQSDAQRAVEDAQLQATYLKKFEAILTPKQLFRYMMAEQKFKSQFMQNRGKHGEHGPGNRPGGPRGQQDKK